MRAALAAAAPADVEEIIRSTGFFRAKTRSLIGFARGLVERHGGVVPRTIAELVPLPGIGRKTANVVIGHAYGVNEGIAVDTHVLRVTNRLGLAEGDDPLKIEAQLMALVPRERFTRTTDLLIFHGRKICDARRPACGVCPLFADCRWESRQAWASGAPPKAKRSTRSRPRAQRPAARRPAAAQGEEPGAPPPPDERRSKVSPEQRALVAVVQMTSTAEVERNLKAAEALVEQAAARGASLHRTARELRLPALRRPARARAAGPRRRHGSSAWPASRGGCASRCLLGSLPERVPGDTRVRNTSVLLGPDGETLAVYRKIHLFDIDLPGMEHLKESKAVAPGEELVVASTAIGPIGLSICYDMRFPELYRELGRRGARVLCVPSAFTERTGKAHWEVLLRARAIENLAYVFAPAQVGHHGGGRASHGQAMIVDPWGAVVAQVPDGEGIALAELDFARLERLRRELPALQHARLPLAEVLTEGPKCPKNLGFAFPAP